MGAWVRVTGGLAALALGGRVAAAADRCLVSDPDAAGPSYRVVILVDRSGSMQAIPDAIRDARDRAGSMLGRLEGTRGRVGVKLAAFDAGLRAEVYPPEPGAWATPQDAAARLDDFLPADPDAYDGRQTCIRRSVWQLVHRELPADVPDTATDLARPVPWDFLVFTDQQEACRLDDAAERAWVARNEARNLRVKVWPLARGEPPDLMEGWLAFWNAPLAAVRSVHDPGGAPVETDGTVVTFVPRLVGGADAPCPAGGGGAPEVPTFLVHPDGSRTDEGPWRLEGTRDAGVFQAWWRPAGPVLLPDPLAVGRHRVVPSDRVVCDALVAAGGGRAVTPVASTRDCALATVEVSDRPVLVLDAPSGSVDAPLGGFEPRPWGRYPSRTRELAVSARGATGTVRLTVDAPGYAVPDDVALCAGGTCAGAVTVPASTEPASLRLRLHPRGQRWWPWAALTGTPIGAPEGEGRARVCADLPGAVVRCADCAEPADADGCVTVTFAVRRATLHPASWVLLFLAALAAFRWHTAPRFAPGLYVGRHRLRNLHGGLAVFLGRPLVLTLERGRTPTLGVRGRPDGRTVVGRIWPRSGDRGGAFELRAASRDLPLRCGTSPVPTTTRRSFHLMRDGQEKELLCEPSSQRVVRATIRYQRRS